MKYEIAICPEFKSFLVSMIPNMKVILPETLRDELHDRVMEWVDNEDE